MMEGRRLLDAIMPSAQRQALARGLHDRIERSSRTQRALVLSAREPVTSLNLLQVSIVASHQTIVLHDSGACCVTIVLPSSRWLQSWAICKLVRGNCMSVHMCAHACKLSYRALPAHMQLLATCSQVPAVSGS